MLKLKRLDRYIMGKFLGTYFYALLLIIVIVVIFDISEKIDDFLDKQTPLKIIVVDYYFNFIPYFANLFSSMFVFISVIFFTSKMAGDSEIIAILSSGVSYRRLMLPYFLSALILAIFSVILINWVIPPANKKRLEFEEKYIRVRYSNKEHDIHRQILPGEFIYMESFNNIYNIGNKFAIEKFENGKLKSKLISENVQWDTSINKWRITNYFIRDYSEGKEIVTSGRRIDTTLNMLPSDFAQRNNVVEAMNYNQLNQFIEDETRKGTENVILWKIEKHKRLAYPFSTFILTLIGVTLSSRKTRGGIGFNIGMGILLTFTYIMFMQVTTVLATNANVDPLLAVWIPNIIFSFIGVYLYLRARR